jgi:pyruvate carboxylase
MLLGAYGRLPAGWPADWVYRSAFGDEAERRIASRREESPLESVPDEDLEAQRQACAEQVGRAPTEDEFILWLMHPKDALDFIAFRERFGEATLALPTAVWRAGLRRPGDRVDFDFSGKPYSIELVSVGAEHEGRIHVVVRVNNRTQVYTVETPRAKKVEIRMATRPGQIGAPANGNIWRIGNPERGLVRVGDIVHQGEEIANLEAMKMENAILAPFDGQIAEVCVRLNESVREGQLLVVIERAEPPAAAPNSPDS